jgi:2-polyprenyl-3-methyl-5-hydroxy-6-metoxy-1,4-benzoquinol methylase
VRAPEDTSPELPGHESQDTPGSPIPDEVRRANAAHWDEWTRVHEVSAFYDVDGFRAGATSLWPLELEELGPFVGEGTTFLHLQCHFGLDTLSWARRGAVVTGVDLSEEAISLARQLADEVGLAGRARFIASDIYEADEHLGAERFDVVFVSWGAIEWLPDLERWARLIARHLRPGGVFYMAEIHPIAYALDETPDHGVRLAYRYLPAPDKPDRSEYDGSYADADAHVENRLSYSWAHGMGEILTAVGDAGLRLEFLHESPFSVAPFFDWMERDDQRWWWLPDGRGGRRSDLPFSYSIMARKPGEPQGHTSAADGASKGVEAGA